MKKYLFSGLIALFAVTLSAHSQVRIGVQGSFIGSTMTFDADEDQLDADLDDYTEVRPSFRAGIVVEVPLTQKLSLMPTLSYVSSGSKLEGEEKFVGDGSFYKATIKGSFKPNFVELPVNVVYKFKLANGSSVFAGAGPSISMGLGGSYKMKVSADGLGDDIPDFSSLDTKGKIKFDGKKESELSENDEDIHFKRFTFGGNITAGFQLPNGVFFQANYNQGFTKLNPDAGAKIRTGYVGVGVGYFFN